MLQVVDLGKKMFPFASGGFQPVIFGGGLPNGREEFFGLPGFADESEDVALVDRGDYRIQIYESREEQPDRLRVPSLELRQQLDPRDLRHALIRHDDVNFLLLHQLVALFGAVCLEDSELAAQQVVHGVAHIGLVIDDQQAVLGSGHDLQWFSWDCDQLSSSQIAQSARDRLGEAGPAEWAIIVSSFYGISLAIQDF
jgi:hypothetical protein